MLTLKIISMCIILIEVLRKRWLQAFFKKERFYFEIVLQINLKIYSFQAAGKNKIIAKNALFPDIYISIKKFSLRWYSVFCLMSFRFQAAIALKSIIYKNDSVCVCACMRACVRVCDPRRFFAFYRTRCRRSLKTHRIRNLNAHRQYISI